MIEIKINAGALKAKADNWRKVFRDAKGRFTTIASGAAYDAMQIVLDDAGDRTPEDQYNRRGQHASGSWTLEGSRLARGGGGGSTSEFTLRSDDPVMTNIVTGRRTFTETHSLAREPWASLGRGQFKALAATINANGIDPYSSKYPELSLGQSNPASAAGFANRKVIDSALSKAAERFSKEFGASL